MDKFIPDPGGKKAPDPGSITLAQITRFELMLKQENQLDPLVLTIVSEPNPNTGRHHQVAKQTGTGTDINF
jgi:hypothetical protein